MQCCLVVEIIDGHEIVRGARERTYDPMETTKYVAEHFPGAKISDLDSLFKEHSQYAPLKENERDIPDNSCCAYKDLLANLQSGEMLLSDNSVINDCRNKEYWEKDSGRWVKNKILLLGENLPEGAIWVEDLNKEDYQQEREEIAAQQETERIAALTPEQKELELQAALDASADEADRVNRRSQIQGKAFDPVSWYREKAAALHEKYGIPYSTPEEGPSEE